MSMLPGNFPFCNFFFFPFGRSRTKNRVKISAEEESESDVRLAMLCFALRIPESHHKICNSLLSTPSLINRFFLMPYFFTLSFHTSTHGENVCAREGGKISSSKFFFPNAREKSPMAFHFLLIARALSPLIILNCVAD